MAYIILLLIIIIRSLEIILNIYYSLGIVLLCQFICSFIYLNALQFIVKYRIIKINFECKKVKNEILVLIFYLFVKQ